MKKGQMVFEFVIAAVLLFGIIIYSITYINMNVANFRSDSFHNDLEVKSIQISEMLIHNMGDYNTPALVGFASTTWPNVSVSSVSELALKCSTGPGYAELLESLDLLGGPYLSPKSNYDFKITVKNSTDVLVDCKDPSITTLPTGIYVAHSKRFALTENADIVSIDVWVW